MSEGIQIVLLTPVSGIADRYVRVSAVKGMEIIHMQGIGGCIGVFIAWKLVTGLPMFWLINLICLVLVWTSYTLLSAAKKDKAKGIA